MEEDNNISFWEQLQAVLKKNRADEAIKYDLIDSVTYSTNLLSGAGKNQLERLF